MAAIAVLGFNIGVVRAYLLTEKSGDLDLCRLRLPHLLRPPTFCLPARVDVTLTNEHWDWFPAIICFLPELLFAALGGVLAAALFRLSAGRLSESDA